MKPAKPFRIVTVYDSGASTEKRLKEIGAEFTKRHVLNGFWGVEFTIMKPRGKGTTAKARAIWSL